MDDKIWQAYEAEHAALRRRYRRIRWRIALIWLAYFSVTTAVLLAVVYPWRMDVGLFALLFNTIVSVFLTLFTVNGKLKEEQTQRQALIEKAPVGKIRLHD